MKSNKSDKSVDLHARKISLGYCYRRFFHLHMQHSNYLYITFLKVIQIENRVLDIMERL